MLVLACAASALAVVAFALTACELVLRRSADDFWAEID